MLADDAGRNERPLTMIYVSRMRSRKVLSFAHEKREFDESAIKIVAFIENISRQSEL